MGFVSVSNHFRFGFWAMRRNNENVLLIDHDVDHSETMAHKVKDWIDKIVEGV